MNTLKKFPEEAYAFSKRLEEIKQYTRELEGKYQAFLKTQKHEYVEGGKQWAEPPRGHINLERTQDFYHMIEASYGICMGGAKGWKYYDFEYTKDGWKQLNQKRDGFIARVTQPNFLQFLRENNL